MDYKKKFGKVAVIMGGESDEREISLLSGNAVLASLLKSGVNAFGFDPKYESVNRLKEWEFDRAFIALHGKGGEDGSMQGALECFKIPYTGSGVTASAIGMNKLYTKIIWDSINIPTPKYQVISKSDFLEFGFELKLNLPIIIKPLCNGSTIGISKVFESSEVHEKLQLLFNTYEELLVEELIIGSEYAVPILDNEIFPFVQVSYEKDFDYQTKYFTDKAIYTCPYDFGDNHEKICNVILNAYKILGARSVARIDFMLDKNSNLYLLEINTIPGMTSHSFVPLSFMNRGYNFDKLCLMMLERATLGV